MAETQIKEVHPAQLDPFISPSALRSHYRDRWRVRPKAELWRGFLAMMLGCLIAALVTGSAAAQAVFICMIIALMIMAAPVATALGKEQHLFSARTQRLYQRRRQRYLDRLRCQAPHAAERDPSIKNDQFVATIGYSGQEVLVGLLRFQARGALGFTVQCEASPARIVADQFAPEALGELRAEYEAQARQRELVSQDQLRLKLAVTCAENEVTVQQVHSARQLAEGYMP